MPNISAFIPLRAGSERVKEKNTRPFHPDGRSLFQLKLFQLAAIADHFEEIIISTNDTRIITQFNEIKPGKNFRLIPRPDHLCRSDTKVQDLIDYVPEIVQSEWIFWLHVTSPFINEMDYKAALNVLQKRVINGEHDSIMSVNRIQQFIWDEDERKVINVNREINPWPNTQQLKPLYEINHAFYVNSRKNFLLLRDRIGNRPCLYECRGIRKLDIDWPEDFQVARSLVEQIDG